MLSNNSTFPCPPPVPVEGWRIQPTADTCCVQLWPAWGPWLSPQCLLWETGQQSWCRWVAGGVSSSVGMRRAALHCVCVCMCVCVCLHLHVYNTQRCDALHMLDKQFVHRHAPDLQTPCETTSFSFARRLVSGWLRKCTQQKGPARLVGRICFKQWKHASASLSSVPSRLVWRVQTLPAALITHLKVIRKLALYLDS